MQLSSEADLVSSPRSVAGEGALKVRQRGSSDAEVTGFEAVLEHLDRVGAREVLESGQGSFLGELEPILVRQLKEAGGQMDVVRISMKNLVNEPESDALTSPLSRPSST